MKHTRMLLIAAMTLGLTMTVSAKTINYNKAISAELPEDFAIRNTEDHGMTVGSADGKTTLFMRSISTESMPSTWKMPKEYDEHFLKVEEMKQIKKKRAPFWDLTKNYYRRWYVMADGDTLISETRMLTSDVVFNTCILDNGQRSEAIDQYFDTLHANMTASQLFWQTFDNGKWFWLFIAIILTAIGAIGVHGEKRNFLRGLVYGLVCAAVVFLLCLVTMFGAWGASIIYCIIAFLLGHLATWSGFYLTPDEG